MAVCAWLAVLCIAPLTGRAAAKCELRQVAQVPITMNSLRPLIDTKINGRDAKFIIDSGAFYSMISEPTAREYGLRTYPAPFGFKVLGVGGSTTPQVARVHEFTLLGVPIKDVEFLVGGSEVGYQGLLGQNLLQNFDVEYDLAHGVIRLFKSKDCGNTILAYWATPGQRYSAMPIEPLERNDPHTVGTGKLNGKDIRITFDTGAFTSILSTGAAARAGIKPDSPGVQDAGTTHGIGSSQVHSYIATFTSLDIGDGEQIRNARLRFAELFGGTDMLLGADFFVSHRVFVGNREHRLFMTYNGGPVFNLSRHENPAAESPEEGTPPLPDEDAALTDPAELARRGSARAARQDYPAALADLSKALELAPDNPEYVFERGRTYAASGDGERALADFDRVIALKHDFLPAYIPRAEIRLAQGEQAAALLDLDTVRELSPPQADSRFTLAELYQRMDEWPAAIKQYGIWISNHREDSRQPAARASRCLASALANQDLKTARDDCEFGLRHIDKSSKSYGQLWVNRGLLYLREGNNGPALADFNQALKLMPENARAYYGRAVVEARAHQQRESEQDVAQATRLSSAAVKRLQSAGFVP